MSEKSKEESNDIKTNYIPGGNSTLNSLGNVSPSGTINQLSPLPKGKRIIDVKSLKNLSNEITQPNVVQILSYNAQGMVQETENSDSLDLIEAELAELR
jgi:hypothetical protein